MFRVFNKLTNETVLRTPSKNRAIIRVRLDSSLDYYEDDYATDEEMEAEDAVIEQLMEDMENAGIDQEDDAASTSFITQWFADYRLRSEGEG